MNLEELARWHEKKCEEWLKLAEGASELRLRKDCARYTDHGRFHREAAELCRSALSELSTLNSQPA
jgi:hypothetical protein